MSENRPLYPAFLELRGKFPRRPSEKAPKAAMKRSMREKSAQARAVITVHGPDDVGITAAMMEILSEHRASLIDIEQVVLSGWLTLCFLIEPTDASSALLGDLERRAAELGMSLRVDAVESRVRGVCAEGTRYAVTAIGENLGARTVHLLSQLLAEHGANIEKIRRLSRSALTSLEVLACLPEGEEQARRLRAALVQAAGEADFDIALQRERLTRRAKRLIVFDMDSTLIQMECIDELARLHGAVDRVADITARAMAGELDFEASLRERVGLLKGLSEARALTIADDLPITEGAEEMLRVLRALGFRTAVISGGFTFAAEKLKERLKLDYAYANELEIRDGVLTGGLVGEIIGPVRKAALLREIAEREGIAPHQTIAVGDGANDLPMLEAAGLGIAYHAKPKLKAAADTSVSRGGLDRILYLLGITEDERAEILAEPER